MQILDNTRILFLWTEFPLSTMLLKAVTCLQSLSSWSSSGFLFFFAGENQWRSQSNFKCISAQDRAAQQQVSIHFQLLLFPLGWGKSLKGLWGTNGSWKWSVLLRDWKKNLQRISVCVLNVAWSSFNFSLEIRTEGNFFFLKLGLCLDIWSVLMSIFSFWVSDCLYKSPGKITTTKIQSSSWLGAPCSLEKHFSAACSPAVISSHLVLVWAELWGRSFPIWLHFFPSDSSCAPRAVPSSLRWQSGSVTVPQPCSLCHLPGNSLHSPAKSISWLP